MELAEIERNCNVLTILRFELRNLLLSTELFHFLLVDKVTVMKLHCCETTELHLFYTVALDVWKERAHQMTVVLFRYTVLHLIIKMLV